MKYSLLVSAAFSVAFSWLLLTCDITKIKRNSTLGEVVSYLCIPIGDVDSVTFKPNVSIQNVRLFNRSGSVRIVRRDSWIYGIVWEWADSNRLDSQDSKYAALVEEMETLYGPGEKLGYNFTSWTTFGGTLYTVKSSQSHLNVTWYPKLNDD
jgi:hypothetical protein